MKRILIIGLLGLAACSGSGRVVSVEGVSFGLDDVPIRTSDSTVDMLTFRNALNWLIRDAVLMNAAEDEFGITLPSGEVSDRAEAILATLPEGDLLDPRANLDYFLIQARIGAQGLLWPQVIERLPDGMSQNEWAIGQLTAADVEVDARYGVWRVDPEPLVYEP